jgi:hypothetical protein
VNQTSLFSSNLVKILKREVKIGDIVAVVSNYPPRGLHDTFHTAKAVIIEETECVISAFEHEQNT